MPCAVLPRCILADTWPAALVSAVGKFAAVALPHGRLQKGYTNCCIA